MPDLRRVTCRHCGGHTKDVGPISWRGACLGCGMERMVTNIGDLTTHSGPGFARWRRAVAASVGGVVLDDLAARPVNEPRN